MQFMLNTPNGEPYSTGLYKLVNNVKRFIMVNFKAGEVYDTSDMDYLGIEDLVLTKKAKLRYTKELEALFKSEGVDYEVTGCKVCGGTRNYIEYNVFKQI